MATHASTVIGLRFHVLPFLKKVGGFWNAVFGKSLHGQKKGCPESTYPRFIIYTYVNFPKKQSKENAWATV